jgi:hypothetical protein
MKRILILLFLATGFGSTAFAQKPKRSVPPPIIPPPPVIRKIEMMPAVPKQTLYEKLLNTEDYTTHAFAYTVTADTVLLPNETFRKQLEIGPNGVRLETASAKDTLRISKGAEMVFLSHYVKYTFYDMKIVKDVATLTDKESKEVRKYRLFLNKGKTKVTKMQDLATKEFYLPAESTGTPPTIGF